MTKGDDMQRTSQKSEDIYIYIYMCEERKERTHKPSEEQKGKIQCIDTRILVRKEQNVMY
jgi:hypothetical protein